jgi:21S rRNA (GM2251-2'-O)-methyltransferase
VALEVSKFEPPVISSPEPENPTQNGNELIVFPVNILDPQNLGSIIRSATFYGCTGLVTSLKHSCDFTPIVSKASAGSMEVFQNLFRTKSPLEFLRNAKSQGFQIIGTGLGTNNAPKNSNLECHRNNNRSILLLGNEGSGLSSDILSLCDTNLVISPFLYSNPIILDSLNVGVATGILLDRLRNTSI